MGARREYVINVALEGDASGLQPLERGLKDIESRIGGINDINITANVGGNALKNIKEIRDGMDSIKDRAINVSLGGNVETQLKSIEGHLESISKNTTSSINIGGNADKELKELKTSIETLAKVHLIKFSIDIGEFKELRDIIQNIGKELSSIGRDSAVLNADIGSSMISSLEGVTSELGKIKKELSSLGSGAGSGIGNKLSNEFEGAAYSVGKIQTELNSLKAPTITPKIEMPNMNQYYGSFDQMGHLNMGAMGGSKILSMLGVGAFKDVTYGNASKEQTNEVLLQRMDMGASTQIAAKTYEGGTDTITHAVSQNRTVRNPDLISQLYAFQMATGAKNEDLVANVFGGPEDTEWGQGSMVDVLAAFGESVALQTGSEQLGTSAMFDLAKAYGGQYNSVDQYGISEKTLKQHGYDKDDNNVKEFMRAVGEIIKANKPNDMMETTEGGLTQLRKRFHRAGRMIGQTMMGPIDFLSSQLLKIDKTEFNFAGLTIPKGTFSTAIIGITGLVSAIDPLQSTFQAVTDTFHKITGAVSTAKDKLIGFADSIANLGNLEALRKYNEFGAFNILSQERYGREHYQEILDANVNRVMDVEGLHDFSFDEIDQSGMTWDQKRRTKNSMKLDDKLFELEGGVSDEVKESIHRQVDEYNKGLLEEGRKKGLEGANLRKYVNENKLNSTDLFRDFVAGRKNEISELSNFQKLKEGFKLSFDPQTSAFKDAFKKEKNKYKDGGFFNQVKGKTIGNLKGLKKGLDAFRNTGSITDSFKNLWGVLRGILGVINPVTVILGALGVAVAALGGIFAIAWANSDTFRQKVGELAQKLHDLLDTLVYTVGDTLKNLGLTEKGGAEGISEFATKIVEGITTLVEIAQEILSAMGGRDLLTSKQMDKVEPNFKKKVESIQERKKEGKEVTIEEYRSLLNMAQQIKSFDPNYFTDEKIASYGLKDENGNLIQGYGLSDIVDDHGNKFTEYLQQDYSEAGSYKDASWEGTYDYYAESVVPRLEKEGIKFSDDPKQSSKMIREAIGYGPDAEEKKTKFYKAYNDALLYEQTAGVFGQKWEETEFGKASPALKPMENKERENKSHGIWDTIKVVVDILKIISTVVTSILGLMVFDKALGALSTLLTKKGEAGSWKGAIWEMFKGKFPGLGDFLEGLKEDGLQGAWDKIKEHANQSKDWMQDNVFNAEKVRSVFQETRETVEGMFPNIYEWVQRIRGEIDKDKPTNELPPGDSDNSKKPPSDSDNTGNRPNHDHSKNRNDKNKPGYESDNGYNYPDYDCIPICEDCINCCDDYFGNDGGSSDCPDCPRKNRNKNRNKLPENKIPELPGPSGSGKHTPQLPIPGDGKKTPQLPPSKGRGGKGGKKNFIKSLVSNFASGTNSATSSFSKEFTKNLKATTDTGKVIDVEILEPTSSTTKSTGKVFEEASSTASKTAMKSEGVLSKVKGLFSDLTSHFTRSPPGDVIDIGKDGVAKTGVFEGVKKTVKSAGSKVTGWVGEKLGGNILKRITGYFAGKAAVGSIPFIGEIIDGLWMAWDVCSWIGDALDFHIPWLGEIFSWISPMRSIQKHWNDIVSGFQWGCDQISNFLRSIGLGFVVDGLQWVYTKLTEVWGWLQGLPIIGWLLGGTGESNLEVPTTGGLQSIISLFSGGNGTPSDSGLTSSNNYDTSGITNGITSNFASGTPNPSQPLETNTMTVNATNMNMNKDPQIGVGITPTTSGFGFTANPLTNGINPMMNSTPMGPMPATTYANGGVTQTQQQPMPETNNTINNNINIENSMDSEKLAKIIIQVINERFLWDAQKAGRTVDGQPNLQP